MANVEWEINNALGQAVGVSAVDEDQTMKVPSSTDTSESKRAGDMIVGDRVCHGRSVIYEITTIVA